ncbi:hypothetical protein AURDEDRAFT_157391 [Auricularia subglabra TFB-10046 SS5]|nr:hypothetical protein AURDEDRAFT_157391 [Auricularia subglabra TFB-10046 SS5]
MSLADATANGFYRRWELLQSPSWEAFYLQWWAGSGLERIRRALEVGFLTVDQSDVCIQLGVLIETGGVMYLRDEVTQMYDRVSAAFDGEFSGAVYTGMPACGKSVGLFYMLLSRMATGVPVMFSSSAEQCFVFDDAGVWYAETARARNTIHLDTYIEASARMWSFIDHPVACVGHPEPALLNVALLFPIHAVRFEGRRYSSWATHAYVPPWHMDPWTIADMLRCLPLYTAFRQLAPLTQKSLLTESAIDQIIKKSGPTPAGVLEEILEPGCTEKTLRQALRNVDVKALDELRSHINAHYVPNDLADLVLLWKRHIPPRGPGLSDLVEAGFKSDLAFALLCDCVCDLNLRCPPALSPRDRPQLLFRAAFNFG